MPKSSRFGGAIKFQKAFRVGAIRPEFRATVNAFLTDWGYQNSKSGLPLQVVLNPKLKAEEYRLTVDDSVKLEASTAVGVAWGLQTLGQILDSKPVRAVVSDAPDASFRCLLVDVARRYHSPSTLRTLIRWCQAGKVRFLQLHLTDDQNWMFPSKVVSGVDRANTHGRPAYTVTELKELQSFAAARGVCLIPEIDLPGHSSLLTKLNPALFQIQGSSSQSCIDFASAEVRKTIKSLLNEVMDAFPDSPFIHIGGDEASYPDAGKDPDFANALLSKGAGATTHDIFIDFVADLANEVIRRKKTPIVWEGFSASQYAKQHIPRQTVVIAWEGYYYPASQLIPDGFRVINGGWDPNYVVNHYPYDLYTLAPLERLYGRNPSTFGVVDWANAAKPSFEFPKSDLLLGSILCWWEGREWNAQKVLPSRILAFGSRLWNRGENRDYPSFLNRLSQTKSRIERNAFPFEIESKGLINSQSAQVTDRAELKVIPKERNLKIAFRTDGSPPSKADTSTNNSILITNSTILTIQAFRGDIPVGETQFLPLQKVTVIPNLALRCPVTTNASRDPMFPASCVTDGIADDLSAFWLAYPNPQNLTIDFGKSQKLNQLEIVAFWATGNPTHYRLSLSEDGKTWKTVVDASDQTGPTTKEGYIHPIPVESARYIRLETFGGPLFPSTMTRINEIRAFLK